MNHHKLLSLSTLALGLCLSACAGSGWEPAAPDQTEANTAYQASVDTVARFEERDPSMKTFLANAYGFAVYPSVGKGAAWIGGAYGRGLVYRKGQVIGGTSVTQITAGAQLGGQAYSEIVFFRDAAALREFTEEGLRLGAQASAIAVTAGAATNASYDDGVAIFTLPKGGLMYEASVAGQVFTFDPVQA